MTEPPLSVVEQAVKAARNSPCAKSKRGVVVFGMCENGKIEIFSEGFNGPPAPFDCSGRPQCIRDCGRIAVHAEIRALAELRRPTYARYRGKSGMPVDGLHLVHVKAVHGELVPGGGPSCEACSKVILDRGVIDWIWLYERPVISVELRNVPEAGEPDPPNVWRKYDARDFHEISLENAKGGPLHSYKEHYP